MTDQEIQRNVLDEFKWDARIQPNEIGVAVKDGVVTLAGNIDSYMKKWQAEEIALRVRGVRVVANELQVKLPSRDERTDEDIAHAAKQALDSSLEVPDSVRVSVDGGIVTLRGEVEWQHQRRAAGRSVSNLVGVKGVINLIEIK
ncbi:MAG TPA: BON domain-containing protein, partial [Polyangiaceae bacterium]|nr:BON domain-containing protein [Polyangiaceae bacterium]